MPEHSTDRRVQRTRQLLKRSLIRLINEKGYDAVTIQDITEHANLGRTTFYLHYQSKDELLLDHHAELLDNLDIRAWSREELLLETEATGLIAFLERVAGGRGVYMAIQGAKDNDVIQGRIQAQMVTNLSQSITDAFPNSETLIPMSVLCNYVVGAQLGIIKWWMTTRTDYTPRHLAHMIQRLQYAAIADALGLLDKT